MNRLLKYPSYLFHPIWMPFAGTFIYFLKVPRFFPEEVIKAKLMAVAIMTLFIPIVFFFMLRTLNQARGIFLESVEERKWPLLFYCVIQLVILQYIVNRFDFMELYHFYKGILISTLVTAVFVYFKKKISLHLVGLTGLIGFMVVLSYFYKLNMIPLIAILMIISGLTATSRLHMKAHTSGELFWGTVVGFTPQILVLQLWFV